MLSTMAAVMLWSLPAPEAAPVVPISLASAPRQARLLEVAALAPGQAEAGATSPEAIRARIAELNQSRPSLGGPIAMLAVGVILLGSGLSFGIVGAEYVLLTAYLGTTLRSLGLIFLVAGLVAVVVGIPLVIVGAVGLRRALQERKAIRQELNELRQQLRADAPPPDALPGPLPAMVVASF
jgi:hypothetical protein